MLLTESEIGELCTAISMKPGHRKRFPALLKRARDQSEREEKLRQDQAEREEHERQLAKVRRKIELEEAGGETKIGMKEQGNAEIQATDHVATIAPELPEGKNWGVFISHKKVWAAVILASQDLTCLCLQTHSLFGDASVRKTSRHV